MAVTTPVPPLARTMLDEVRRAGRRRLDEAEGKVVLAAFDLPVPAHRTTGGPADVAAAASELTPPLVVKLLSPHVVHKSEIGGVAVGLADPRAAAGAAAALWRRADEAGVPLDDRGVLVEEMAPAGVEVILGTVTDPVFGPVLSFGIGGVYAEVYADVVFRRLPLRVWDVPEMIADLRGSDILAGARGRPVALDDLVDFVERFAGAGGVLDRLRGDVAECECNPVIVGPGGVTVVDVVMTLHG